MLTTYVSDALAVVGALYTLVSVVASILPAGKVKSALSAFALDLDKLKAL